MREQAAIIAFYHKVCSSLFSPFLLFTRLLFHLRMAFAILGSPHSSPTPSDPSHKFPISSDPETIFTFFKSTNAPPQISIQLEYAPSTPHIMQSSSPKHHPSLRLSLPRTVLIQGAFINVISMG